MGASITVKIDDSIVSVKVEGAIEVRLQLHAPRARIGPTLILTWLVAARSQLTTPSSSEPIAGTTTYDAATKTVCFVPGAPLIAGAKHTVRVKAKSFKTEDGPCETDRQTVFWTAAPTVQLRVTADADEPADDATALEFKADKGRPHSVCQTRAKSTKCPS